MADFWKRSDLYRAWSGPMSAKKPGRLYRTYTSKPSVVLVPVDGEDEVFKRIRAGADDLRARRAIEARQLDREAADAAAGKEVWMDDEDV